MKRTALIICTLFALAAAVPVSAAAEEPLTVVGRIFHIEGELLRFVPEQQDWVTLVKDAPFAAEDTLFAGTPGMAELILPNGSWIRIGNNTRIRFIALEADQTAVDVASGIVRFYGKDARTVIKVTSPYGYVLSDPGAVFDYRVGSNSIEVIGIRGNANFVQSATGARYTASPGAPSILVYDQQVYSGPGTVDSEWNRWNTLRDDFWASKNRVPGRSVAYLPPSLHDEAYALDENGRWEKVYYDGSLRWFWRPTSVAIGWSPFTAGRWTDWNGDQTWIPAETFGYITHHYGNWIYVGNSWYWAPPVVSVRVGLPLLDIGFFWYPGRVSWVHSGIYIGWVPLAPHETYYTRRHWGGPRTAVVKDVHAPHVGPRERHHVYANHAVVVKQQDLWRVNDYRKARVPGINRTTIIRNYRETPVVDNTVIINYSTDKQRHRYTDVPAIQKPHDAKPDPARPRSPNPPVYRKATPPAPPQQTKERPEVEARRETPSVEKPKGAKKNVPAGNVYTPKTESYQGKNESTNRSTGTVFGRPGAAGKAETRPAGPESAGAVQPLPAKQAPTVPPQIHSGRQGQSAVRTTGVTPAKNDRQENGGKNAPPAATAPKRRTAVEPAKQGQPDPAPDPAWKRERAQTPGQDPHRRIGQPQHRARASGAAIPDAPPQRGKSRNR
ncbi:MAG: hypothetical protein JW950_02930 [Deltaproteobacteria bacterium]|nr:hypothetical protein [Deltaproteobacteria bacterium]